MSSLKERGRVKGGLAAVLAAFGERAAPTWKKTFGFHPLAAFADHGAGAAGEALAILLRPGNAGSVRHEVAQVEWIRQKEVG